MQCEYNEDIGLYAISELVLVLSGNIWYTIFRKLRAVRGRKRGFFKLRCERV